MKLLLKIAYDGTAYCGWQFQPNVRTVQAELTRAIREIFGFDCDVTGSSRTDSGVHARGFCATVAERGRDSISCTIPLEKLPRAINARLPEDIAVLEARWVGSDFHARYGVRSKRYVYRMHIGGERSPFERRYAWHLGTRLEPDYVSRMNAAAAYFVGKHDFTSFMAQGSRIEDATRTVFSASVRCSPDAPEVLLFEVEANGFLYNMVRIMVGTLVEVAQGSIEPHQITDIMDARDRSRAGRTAPPYGLFLEEVVYPL